MRRNTIPLIPLVNVSYRLLDRLRERGVAIPDTDYVPKVTHARFIRAEGLFVHSDMDSSFPDNLSIQNQTRRVRKDTFPPGYVKQITARLQWARKRLRPEPSQADVAVELGIERDTYSRYEQRTPVPQHHVVAVCKVLRINPVWLLSGEGNAEELPPPAQQAATLRSVK
jgi:hypothetical protein